MRKPRKRGSDSNLAVKSRSAVISGKAPARGETVGRWTLQHRIGRGGNGEVWSATDDTGGQGAVKLLMKMRPVPYARFKDEVTALKMVASVPGILPLLDSDLPPTPGSRRPWYMMPLAIPIASALLEANPRSRVLAIAEAAETLAELHLKRIAHRDIKPGNLLFYRGRCHVADFGLVDYPNKADLTATREQVGPQWTMAPEVRREGHRASPFPADVYSLAKTLWIILTQEQKGFEGQYLPGGDRSIRTFCGSLYITPLEEILSQSTQDRAERRPTMQAFAERLREWLHVSDQFDEHNPLQWAEVQRRLFPLVVPEQASWTNIDDIVTILNILGETSDLNHLFFPDGGGLDLDSARRSEREANCIEFRTSNLVNVVKPIKLVFESFHGEPEWNYFRLETGGLEPSGVYPGIEERLNHEELTEIGSKRYADRSCWDAGEYRGRPLPTNSRIVSRFFSGAFVIFQKTSIYNRNPSTYDARHNTMSAEEFRTHIAAVIAQGLGADWSD